MWVYYSCLATDTRFFKVISLLNIINEEKFLNAIKSTNFVNLKNKEFNEKFDESVYSNDGKKINFFNLGPMNKWENNLNPKIRKKIEDSFGDEMKEIGYL